MSATRPRVSTRRLMAVGILVCLVLAGVVSHYASKSPDGLMSVADEQGFLGSARPHVSDGSPFAGYATRGISNARVSGGVAGIVGGALVFVIAGGLFLAVRRRDGAAGARTPTQDATGTDAETDAGTATEMPRRLPAWPPTSAATSDMGAGHGHHLHFHGHSPVHHLPAHLKLLAVVGFVLAVVAHAAGPRWPRIAVYLSSSCSPQSRLAGCRSATTPSGWSSRCPFVVFALLMPFVADRARGSRCSASRLSASRPARRPGRCWPRAPWACWPR